VGLNPTQATSFAQAVSAIRNGLNAGTAADRLTFARQALQTTQAAAPGLGTNLNLQIGDGTLTF